MDPRDVLPLLIVIGITRAQSDGDLRLINVQQDVRGSVLATRSTLTYNCVSKVSVLNSTTSGACATNTTRYHEPTKPVGGYEHQSCPSGWKYFDGVCYFYNILLENWEKARQRCKHLGGDLARIKNADHGRFIFGQFPKRRKIWILLNDRREEGTFEYVEGEAPEFTNFADGEPDDGGAFFDQDCVTIKFFSTEWEDVDCTNRFATLCSKNSEPYGYDSTTCEGTESRLSECATQTGTCQADRAVSVGCSFSVSQFLPGTATIVISRVHYQGLLQVWSGGEWRPVCDDGFNMAAARVTCREFSMTSHTWLTFPGIRPERGLLYEEGCDSTGTEETCSRNGKNTFYCPTRSYSCVLTHSCTAGHFDDDCGRSCGRCLGGTCNPGNMSCPAGGCETGYTGDACDTVCQGNMWGDKCIKTCGNCQNRTTCDVMDGTCPTGECGIGYTGVKCLTPCPEGRWGLACAATCGECNSGSCDVISGDCPGGSCEKGYTGSKCEQECQTGKWGADCAETCGKCLDKSCNIADGTCPSGVCISGYTGANCDTAIVTEGSAPVCDNTTCTPCTCNADVYVVQSCPLTQWALGLFCFCLIVLVAAVATSVVLWRTILKTAKKPVSS